MTSSRRSASAGDRTGRRPRDCSGTATSCAATGWRRRTRSSAEVTRLPEPLRCNGSGWSALSVVAATVEACQGGMTFEQRRAALEQARAALDGLADELWTATGADLGSILTLVDGVAGLGGGGARRGAVRGGRARGGRRRHARGAALAARARALVARRRFGAGRAGGRAPRVCRGMPRCGLPSSRARVPVANAACVVEEYERVGHRLHPWAQEPAMDLLVTLAEEGGRREIRGRAAAARRALRTRRRAPGRAGPSARQDVAVAADGRRHGALRVPPPGGRGGHGDDRGCGAGVVGAATC